MDSALAEGAEVMEAVVCNQLISVFIIRAPPGVSRFNPLQKTHQMCFNEDGSQ